MSLKQQLDVVVKPANDRIEKLILTQENLIVRLANIGSFDVSTNADKPAASSVVVANGVEIYVVLEGLVDLDAERARLQKELDAAVKDAQKFEKKLSNPGFLNNAKPEIIEKDKAKLAKLQEDISRLKSQL